MAWNKIKQGLKDFAEKDIKLVDDEDNFLLKKKQEKQELQERLAKMDKEGTAYCPKCYSTDLSANKRGFKVTTGLIGRNKIVVTCLKCGNKFKAGK